MNFKKIYEASNLDNPLERDAKRKKEFENKISNILGENWKLPGTIDFETDSIYDEVLNLVDEYSDIAGLEHNDEGDYAEEYWYIYDKDSDDVINYRKEQFNNTLFDKWGVKDGDKVSEVHIDGSSYDGERIYYNPTIKITDYGYELEILNPTEIRNGNGRKMRPRNWGYKYSLKYIVDIKK